jgi:hypothetical protein
MITWKSWPDFKEMTVDGPVENTFGYTISEIEQDCSKWVQRIHEPDKLQYNELISSLNDDTKIEVALSYRVVRKDGEIRDVVGTAKKVHIDGNAMWIGYLVDLSHLKSIGLELYVKGDNMNSKTNIHDGSDSLKSLFHDLMTPISTIELNVSMIDQLLSTLDSDRYNAFYEKFQRIKRSVSKLKSILEGMNN